MEEKESIEDFIEKLDAIDPGYALMTKILVKVFPRPRGKK